jgi:hypothetical protein
MWADNVKMDLTEIGLCGVGWIGMAQDSDKLRALVNAVINCQVATQLVGSQIVLSSIELVITWVFISHRRCVSGIKCEFTSVYYFSLDSSDEYLPYCITVIHEMCAETDWGSYEGKREVMFL